MDSIISISSPQPVRAARGKLSGPSVWYDTNKLMAENDDEDTSSIARSLVSALRIESPTEQQ